MAVDKTIFKSAALTSEVDEDDPVCPVEDDVCGELPADATDTGKLIDVCEVA